LRFIKSAGAGFFYLSLSESGYPGFEDLQDVGYCFDFRDLIILKLSESGYPGFEDLQDVGYCFDFRDLIINK
jgi:hypothetical protein